jgi:hypothetical protein
VRSTLEERADERETAFVAIVAATGIAKVLGAIVPLSLVFRPPSRDAAHDARALPALATSSGHKTDTSETTRATPRDAALRTHSFRFAGKTASLVIARVRAMVRRGSTVRVRQRAFSKPPVNTEFLTGDTSSPGLAFSVDVTKM